MLKVIFLGTNGWYDSITGNTICVLIETPLYNIIFDAGYGLSKLDAYIAADDDRPAYLFISHFHLDHVAGVHTLAKFKFPGGLNLCIPKGTRSVLETLINQPFTMPLAELPYPVRVLDLPDELSVLPFHAEAKPLRHASFTMGYRVEVDERIITYCPDTGYCDNAVDLSRSADLLIAECAFASGREDETWPHLNPESAARIAFEAKARRLVLVHFDAEQYPTLMDRERAASAAQKTFPNTTASKDGMELIVE
ncbi:MAG: MBL fold metallo-hydrolase [Syntrophales bacterium]|nr:MBL fold metallo-hydrolase [Syntrophales bacterium]